MADKSPGKSLRKPALSLKERRAANRAKVIESTPIARASASGDPIAGLSAVFVKNAIQIPLIGCYLCGYAVFLARRLPDAKQFDRHAGRECAHRVESMLAGATVWASCSSVGSVDHAALCRARCWTRPGRCAVGMRG